jgi:hypothetical protein
MVGEITAWSKRNISSIGTHKEWHRAAVSLDISIVGFSILLRVYSQSQIKPPYATQYSVFPLYYINLHNMFWPLMVAILRCNYNYI